MKSSVVKFSRYYSPTIKREARRRQREEREHKPGLSINITRSSGYRAREIAPSRTIGRFLWGDVLFFPFVSSPPPREGRADVETSAKARNTFRRLLSRPVSCIMSYYKPIVAYIYVYTGASRSYPLREKERKREEREGRRSLRHEGPSLHKSALRPRRALSTSE